mgnify:CR=1 FL=1
MNIAFITTDIIKELKKHYNVSYSKGYVAMDIEKDFKIRRNDNELGEKLNAIKDAVVKKDSLYRLGFSIPTATFDKVIYKNLCKAIADRIIKESYTTVSGVFYAPIFRHPTKMNTTHIADYYNKFHLPVEADVVILKKKDDTN